MTPLEQRYRRVLRLLPADYRQEWEEDMVDTFLASRDSEDPDQAELIALGSVGFVETLSVARLALRLRLTESPARPRAFLWGQTARYVVLAVLLVNSISATLSLSYAVGWSGTGVSWSASHWPFPSWLAYASWAMWPLAFFALLLGLRRTGQIATCTAVAMSLVGWLSGWQDVGVYYVLHLMLLLITALAVLAFHREAPAPRRLLWTAAWALGSAGVVGGHLIARAASADGLFLITAAGWICLAYAVAVTVVMAGRVRPIRGAQALALLLLAPEVLYPQWALFAFLGDPMLQDAIGNAAAGPAVRTAVFLPAALATLAAIAIGMVAGRAWIETPRQARAIAES